MQAGVGGHGGSPGAWRAGRQRRCGNPTRVSPPGQRAPAPGSAGPEPVTGERAARCWRRRVASRSRAVAAGEAAACRDADRVRGRYRRPVRGVQADRGGSSAGRAAPGRPERSARDVGMAMRSRKTLPTVCDGRLLVVFVAGCPRACSAWRRGPAEHRAVAAADHRGSRRCVPRSARGARRCARAVRDRRARQPKVRPVRSSGCPPRVPDGAPALSGRCRARRRGPPVVTHRPSGRSPHEVLGVLLEHVVDLVEQRVDVVGQLADALLHVGRRLGLDLLDVLGRLPPGPVRRCPWSP